MKGEENMVQKKDVQPFFSEKEIAFCRLRAEGKTPNQAALEAGYKNVRYGDILMSKEKIKKEISRLSKEEENKVHVAENKEILCFLTSIMRGEEYEEMKDSTIKERMKAAELLGKRLHLFDGRKEADSTVVIIDDIGKKGE